jgi:hypothetical protein
VKISNESDLKDKEPKHRDGTVAIRGPVAERDAESRAKDERKKAHPTKG